MAAHLWSVLQRWPGGTTAAAWQLATPGNHEDHAIVSGGRSTTGRRTG